ncbi:hypothetical protein [Collimonas humicola]|uniref:hypothetical protein n=1 Tax=Collimonas humicola TaxID=2825886 RepID=UPI001B8D19C1|nr:hypothetical protein [Collimonas humicola]
MGDSFVAAGNPVAMGYFLLVAVAYPATEIRGPKGSDSRAFSTAPHAWAGCSALMLSLVRVAWRSYTSPPAIPCAG